MELTLTVSIQGHEYQRVAALPDPKQKYDMVDAWLDEIQEEFGSIGPVYEVVVKDNINE